MTSNYEPIAAALDIGSNTIKMLVVAETENGLIQLAERSSETRISQGISQLNPILSDASMEKSVNVIAELFEEMQSFQPSYTRIVATSAVRDAQNRSDFERLVFNITGQRLDVISGEEEASLIAKGVLTDPELAKQQELIVFDMGGGSVECIHIRDKETQLARSLPLGGVRLMEKHVVDPAMPLSEEEINQVITAVRNEVHEIPLEVSDSENALVVGAGGTYITSRAILADRQGKDLAESSPYLSLDDLKSVFEEAASYPLERRLQIPKLPPNRADVYPVTLLALITLGEWAGVTKFYHCYHSLRWGMAYELLSKNHGDSVF